MTPTSGVATGSVQFILDGTPFGSPVALDGTGYAVSGSITTLSAVSHTVTATYLPTGVFTGSEGQATFTVGKASLTVTADTQTKVYGDAEPALTYTVGGTL